MNYQVKVYYNRIADPMVLYLESDNVQQDVFEALGIESYEDVSQINYKVLFTCESCDDLEEVEFECPDEPHHGGNFICEECGADYYEEYGGNILACNKEAQISHPSLQSL